MDEFDLKAIWQGSKQDAEALPSVALTAQQHSDQSLNLVEQIKSTARMEHRLFLIIAAIGIIVLVIFQLYYWALGLFFFAALMIWKYEVEMRMFNRIQVGNNTLEYLRSVSRLLEKFMQNYRIGILIFIPLVAIGGALLGQCWATGNIDWSLWRRPLMWSYMMISILAGILLSRWWLNFWVNSLYGRKLREMKMIIEDLESLGTIDG